MNTQFNLENWFLDKFWTIFPYANVTWLAANHSVINAVQTLPDTLFVRQSFQVMIQYDSRWVNGRLGIPAVLEYNSHHPLTIGQCCLGLMGIEVDWGHQLGECWWVSHSCEAVDLLLVEVVKPLHCIFVNKLKAVSSSQASFQRKLIPDKLARPPKILNGHRNGKHTAISLEYQQQYRSHAEDNLNTQAFLTAYAFHGHEVTKRSCTHMDRLNHAAGKIYAYNKMPRLVIHDHVHKHSRFSGA